MVASRRGDPTAAVGHHSNLFTAFSQHIPGIHIGKDDPGFYSDLPHFGKAVYWTYVALLILQVVVLLGLYLYTHFERKRTKRKEEEMAREHYLEVDLTTVKD